MQWIKVLSKDIESLNRFFKKDQMIYRLQEPRVR